MRSCAKVRSSVGVVAVDPGSRRACRWSHAPFEMLRPARTQHRAAVGRGGPVAGHVDGEAVRRRCTLCAAPLGRRCRRYRVVGDLMPAVADEYQRGASAPGGRQRVIRRTRVIGKQWSPCCRRCSGKAGRRSRTRCTRPRADCRARRWLPRRCVADRAVAWNQARRLKPVIGVAVMRAHAHADGCRRGASTLASSVAGQAQRQDQPRHAAASASR